MEEIIKNLNLKEKIKNIKYYNDKLGIEHIFI